MPIIGTYPCCGAELWFGLPDAQLPRFAKHNCEECGATVWTWLTRLNPQTWTEESFDKIFKVDYENKSITVRPGMEHDIWGEFREIAEVLGLNNG
jgi:hypothetical protein